VGLARTQIIFFWTSENQIFMRGSKEILGKKNLHEQFSIYGLFLMELNGIWNGNKLWENMVFLVGCSRWFFFFGRDGESRGVGLRGNSIMTSNI